MILRESHARFIGYGAMLLESFVGVMAMVAACAMPLDLFRDQQPAQYCRRRRECGAATISGWGYPLQAQP